MTNNKAPRMQLDLRAVIAKYQTQGWTLHRTDPLTMTKDGETRPVALRDRSGRLV